MRKYFVTRRDWEVGPIFEAQLQQMIDQRWFREGDLVRVGDMGSWQAAERVVPEEGFGSDEDEVIVVDDDDLEERPPPVPTPFMLEQQQRQDAAPPWFRRNQSRFETSSTASHEAAEVHDHRQPRAHVPESRRSHPQRVEWSDDDDARPAGRHSPPSSADEFRFQTAEFQVPEGYQPPFPDEEFEVAEAIDDELQVREEPADESPARPARRSPSRRTNGEANDEHSPGKRDDGVEDVVAHRAHRRRSGADSDEVDQDDGAPRRHPTRPARESEPPAAPKMPRSMPPHSGELHLPDSFRLDADEQHEAELLGNTGRESKAPPGGHQPARSAFDEDREEAVVDLLPSNPKSLPELDFSKLANLASHDPRISQSELPTYEAPKPLMPPEERCVRSMVVASRFCDSLGWSFTAIGIQACLMSVAINGMVYSAFKRLFILSMEVFIPFEGSSEALGEENLAVAGVAMACSIALPALPLAYLIKIDGRVVEYGVTLVVAMFAAAFLNATDGGPLAFVMALLFLAVPSGATALMQVAVASYAEDPRTRQYAAASAALAAATTAMIIFAAPSFGILNELRAFPPAMSINSPVGYGVLLLYGLQCVPSYLIMQRLSVMLLDKATQEMVDEHFLFHGLLTFGGLAMLAMVHQEAITSWFAIPSILVCLTTLGASALNLWSLGTHFLPQLDRLQSR